MPAAAPTRWRGSAGLGDEPVLDDVISVAPLAVVPRSGPAPVHGQAHIVLIDDEPLNSDPLAQYLHHAGYSHVSTLLGPACTVQALRQARPDLVLLELTLLDACAFDILQRLRADSVLRHVPVIVLTLAEDRASRLRALELGVTDVLLKPVDAGELRLRLHNTLAAKADRDQLARTDHATGLPNRDAMLWRLEGAIQHAQRHACSGAVLQVGLERFLHLADALGPAIGDMLLQAVSQRLVAGLRAGDVVSQGAPVLARGSGDEFSVLLPVLARAEDAAIVGHRLLQAMTEPFSLAGHELYVTCRVGVAVFPGDGADSDTVLKQAGQAMRQVQSQAGTASAGLQFYSDALNAHSIRKLGLEQELRLALERQEFRLHYQPQIDAQTGLVSGAEALLRWAHPQRGMLAPVDFIGLVEELGLIVPVGDWVLGEALKQLAIWRQAGLQLPQIAVNVAGLQLQRAELFDEVLAHLQQHAIAGPSLCLEITESAIIDSGPQACETLDALKNIGVHLALDDFGTGYSSLTHLRRFPIDELKIDRSFVTDCDSDISTGVLTGAIIALALRLGLRVVAEGVETQAQQAFVAIQGATACQGYLFAKPLPADEFAGFLASGVVAGDGRQAHAA
jgi:diguanylate cyclase